MYYWSPSHDIDIAQTVRGVGIHVGLLWLSALLHYGISNAAGQNILRMNMQKAPPQRVEEVEDELLDVQWNAWIEQEMLKRSVLDTS